MVDLWRLHVKRRTTFTFDSTWQAVFREGDIKSGERTGDRRIMRQIPCPPEQIHHALYYADLLYGDSATMASEAACLGTSAIYIDDKGRGYTHEQERKYGLVFNFQNTPEDRKKSIRKGISLLTAPGIQAQWQKKRERMLGDKIELTDFLVETGVRLYLLSLL